MDDGRIDPPALIGARLRALRLAMGYANQGAFAALCDIAPRTWNNYEKGKRTPSREEVSKIRHKTHVSMDFVYHGDMRSVTLEMADKIRAAMATIEAETDDGEISPRQPA